MKKSRKVLRENVELGTLSTEFFKLFCPYAYGGKKKG